MNYTWMFVGCMALAILYLRFAPKPRPAKNSIDRFMNFILRWFHSLAWFFLALFCLVQFAGIQSLSELSILFAIIGGMLYFLFLGVFIFNRFSKR